MNTKDPASPFPEWLLEKLEQRGMNMAELARRASAVSGRAIYQSAISQVVSRQKSLGVKLASAIAAALEISEDEVFYIGGLRQQPRNIVTADESEMVYLFKKLSEVDRQIIISNVRAMIRYRKEGAESRRDDDETNKNSTRIDKTIGRNR